MEIGLSTPISSSLSPSNSSKSQALYKFHIPENITYPELLILLIPDSKLFHPEIKLSQNETNFDDNESLTDCHSYDVGVCTVFLNSLKLNSWLYIDVSCYEDCSYTIKLDPSYLNETISINKTKVLHFNTTTSIIINFFLETLNPYEHVIISANPMNPEELPDTFHLYVKQGILSPSSLDFDYYPYPIWHEGKGVSISRLSPWCDFKENVNYTILIEGLQNAVILLQVFSFNHTRLINLNGAVKDIIESGEVHYFVLRISDEEVRKMANSSFLFNLKTFSGNPDLFIHYDSQPDNLEAWEWTSGEEESEGITITQEEAVAVGASGKLFFIAIKGKLGGAYELEVVWEKNDINTLHLYDTLSGIIENQEQVHYRLGIMRTERGLIQVETKVWIGSVKVYLKLCCGQFNCMIKNKNESFESVENTDQVKKMRFRFQGFECPDASYGMIYFAVMVEGASQYMAHYSISAQRGKQSIVLQERIIYRGTLNIKESSYFRYLLLANDTIETMHIQVNLISGEGRVYFSRSSEYPNATAHDISTEHRDFIDLPLKNENLTKGNYYITVEAKTLLDFTVLVFYEKTEAEPIYMMLIDGQPAKFQFDSMDEKFYFQTHNALNCRKVFFNLQAIWGFFTGWVLEIYKNATETQTPGPDSHTYKISEEEGQTIQVNPDVALYKIMVEIDSDFKNRLDLLQNGHTNQFSLMYSTCRTIEEVTFGVVKRIKTLENQRRFFRIRYSSEEDFLKIIAKSEIINKEFYFWGSMSDANQFPSFSLHDFQLNNTDFNKTLTRHDLAPYCNETSPNETPTYNVSRQCSIYLSVESPLEELTFTLLVLRDFSPIRLKEAAMLTMPPLNKDENLQFFYEITNMAPISIFYTSESSHLYLYASVSRDFIYPTSYLLGHNFMSIGTHQLFSELIIPLSFLDNSDCFNRSMRSCFLLMTLQAVKNAPFNIKISVSSLLLPLNEGYPVISSVQAGIIKYFSLKITDKKAESIIISVKPLGEGDPDLYISKGQNSYPTLNHSDWIVDNKKADYIRLSKENVVGNLRGTYTVGVYGYTACTFILNALISKNVQEIFAGIMMEFQYHDNQLLQYSHIGMDGFKIIMMNIVGNSTLYVSSLNEGRFPDADSFLWATDKNWIIVDKHSTNFCGNCPFLLSLYAGQNPSKVSLLIVKENVYSEMQNGRDFTDIITSNLNNFYSFRTVSGYLELSLILLSGDVEVYVGLTPFYEINSTSYLYHYSRKNFTGSGLNIKLGESTTLVNFSGNSPAVQSDHSQIYYFLVSGALSSTYSLRFTTRSQWKILRFGVTDYSILDSFESQIYKFSADQKDEPYSILIMLNNRKSKKHIDLLKVELSGYVNDTSEEFQVLIDEESVRPNSIMLKFFAQSYNYKLNITNVHNKSIPYTLLINTREAEIVDPGAEGRTMYLEYNASHTYELFSPEKKTLMIEVIECYGKVELRGTQDYFKSINGSFDWEFFYPNDNSHILARYNVEKGPVFLHVHSMPTKENETMYYMRSFLVERGEKIPQEVYLAGNDGVFNWKVNEENKNGTNQRSLVVDFFTMQCGKSCKKDILPGYTIVLFSYTLHVTKEDFLLKTTARCDLAPSKDNYYRIIDKEYEENTHPKNDSLEFVFESDGTYFINIVGEVWAFSKEINDYQGFKVLYRQQEVELHLAKNEMSFYKLFKRNKHLQMALVGAILVLFLAVACCCYYRRRKKVLENKVYELNQVKAAEGDVFDEGVGEVKQHVQEQMKLFN